MPGDVREYTDGAFLELIAQMLDAGMSERQVAEAFDDWFSIDLLLRIGALNLTEETRAEIARRFGWIHRGVTAFLALGISYTEYCERRNRRKYVTIEEHHPLTAQSEAAVPLRRVRGGHPGWVSDPPVQRASRAEPPAAYDPDSVPRRPPRLPGKPLPPPPPPWLQSPERAASPPARSEQPTR